MTTNSTLNDITRDQITRAPYTVLTGLAGGLLFTWVQAFTGSTNIAEFLGTAIATKGGYPETFAPAIGWTVHLTIAVSYAVLFSVLWSAFLRTGQGFARHACIAVTAVTVGVATTWIANPAISATIALVSGNGLPEMIAAPYFKLGVPLWNHVAFFAFAAVVTGYTGDCVTALTTATSKQPTFIDNDSLTVSEHIATDGTQTVIA